MKRRQFLFLIIFLFYVPLQTTSASTVSISSARVVSVYETIFDGDVQSIVRELAETGTDVVFRAYWGSDDALGHVPITEGYKLALRVAQIRQQLPLLSIMGGLTGASFSEDGWWPNGTAVTIDDAKQMALIRSSGQYARFNGNPVLDITKPLARRFLVAWADWQIDAGVNSIFFDYLNYVPSNKDILGVKIPVSTYIAAWKQIATSVKQYSMAKWRREVMVTIGEGVVWPYQDFLTKSVKLETVQTQTFSDDWSDYRTQILSTYESLPSVLIFMDWGGTNTPLETFAKLPLQQQISVLILLSEKCDEEKFHFVYPLHKEHVYDAIIQGTYDTIRQLANQTTQTVSTTEMMSQSKIPQASTSSSAQNSSLMMPIQPVSPNISDTMYAAIAIAAIALFTISIVMIKRKRTAK